MDPQMLGGDVPPSVRAFRQFMAQIAEQVCQEFEREVRQMSEDIVKYRGELARCADLLAFQLGKEKQYHGMLENICSNTSVLVGRSSEVGQKHSGNEDTKRAMQQMLEDMFNGSIGAHGGFHGDIDEHRQLAESHLMTSSELQNQSAAVQKELDNILETLKMPPVSYAAPPAVVGPSMMGGQQYGGVAMSQQQVRTTPRSPGGGGAGLLNTPMTQGQQRPGMQSPTSPGMLSPNSRGGMPMQNGAQNYGGQYRPGGNQWA
eukprot:TRINITY_DN102730_c0_g1_i1.p1 TRINITY_DN102730_c0_g1~~TRINITY_DN102730_c0_g1_i1.p1  ORF type:complete len:260 (+),score=52.82 TRINITY_DN102730_c0_g1_i1:88-867(+)